MRKLLCDLCNIDGVSGFEGEILERIAGYVLPYADKVYFDRLGNLICFKKGKNRPKKRIAFAAHADEVGMVIKHIEENGTLLFDDIGIMPSSLPTRRVFVGKGKIRGVIGTKPIHLIPKEARGKNVSADDLYIDIGAESREEAAKHVKVGDVVSFDSETVMLSENILKAKAIDDRAGCAILIGLIKSELSFDTYFAFTRREELGTLGAVQAANEIKPDICVVCESTTASDIYGTPDMQKVVKLGGGAAVPFMDMGTMYSKNLYELCGKVAAENGIKIQTKTKVAGGTDARTFRREAGGCRVLGVAVPTRYIHSAGSVCDLCDYDEAFRLCTQLEKVLGGIE